MSEKRMKAAANQAVSYRNYRRARDRALVKLAQLYPETYKELLEREKANDETQGRKWIDIDGNTTGVDTRSTTPSTYTRETSDQGTNQSNDGGKA